MKRLHLAFVGVAALVAVAVIGCGGGGEGTPTGRNGTLQVRMADAPDPSITALNITVTRVEAHLNGEWQSLPVTAPQTVNLLDLVDQDMQIAQGSLPSGRYNQVRLFVENATVTDADGTHAVTIPGAAQTGIKLNVNYDVNPDDITTLLLDFNVDKSLIKQGNGNYRLQPVIPVVVKVLSGTITGRVLRDALTGAHNAQVSATYTAGTAYPVGTEVNTSSTADDGTFKVWALLPGTYTLNVTWLDGETTRTAVVEGVVVIANQNTALEDITLQ